MEKKTNRKDRERPVDPGDNPVLDSALNLGNLENDILPTGLNRPHVQSILPMTGLAELQRGMLGNPFPLGVYPVFDDDLPRDNTFENFPAPDLRDGRPYPKGLE